MSENSQLPEAPGAASSEVEERFVAQHLRRIFLQIYRIVGNVHDAQDLTQEAFIKALQRQEQLKDEQKGAYSTEDLERYWGVEVFPTPRKLLGYGFGKLEPLFQPCEHFDDRLHACPPCRQFDG